MRRTTYGHAYFQLRPIRGRHGAAQVYISSYVQDNRGQLLAPPLVWVTKRANEIWLRHQT